MKSNKKGFTIVELVIVIAIIAILAAVLIPTFASLVKKANVSADTQLVRNLNMAVEIEKASSNAKHSTMHEALMTAQDAGYDVDTIVAKSGYNIAWDSANDRFVLVDKDAKKYIYPTSENTAENAISNPAYYFLFCDDSAKIDESGFSYYLSKNAKLPEDGAVTVKAGFDAGENKNLKEVTYDGSATKVIFNLNGGKLTVEDTNDNNQQYFYGSLAEAVVSTGNSCFHAYGTIAKLDLQAGKVVAEAGSIVMVSNAASNTEVAKSNGSVVMKTSSDATIDENAKFEESSADEKSAYVLEISDAAGLAAFRDSVNSGMTYEGLTVKLTADIDLSTQGNWNPIGNRYAKNGDTIVDAADENPAVVYAFKGTFDGQGHTISGLFCNSLMDSYAGQRAKDNANFSSSYAALFGNVDGAALKDFTVSGTVVGVDVAGIVGITGNNQTTTIINVVSNVDLTGKQGINDKNEVRGKVAGIVCCPKGNVTIKNCTNNGNIFAIDGPVGGIVAYIDVDITIENCTNNGDVYVNYGGQGDFGQAGGLIGVGNAKCTVTSCTNNGDVSSSTTKENYSLYIGEIIGKLNKNGTAVITKCTYNKENGKYAVGNQKDSASSDKIKIN